MGRKDSKITDKLRKVLVCILMVAGLGVVVYILMPMGDMNLTGIIETSNGGKYGKRVSFLVDYVKSTGNLEIATGLGITEDDLNNFIGGDSTMFDSIFVKETIAGMGIQEGTKEDVLESYKENNPDKADVYKNSNWVYGKVNEGTANERTYMYEKQNENMTYGSNIESQGCYLFAVASAITNTTGILTSVGDILPHRTNSNKVGEEAGAVEYLVNSVSGGKCTATPMKSIWNKSNIDSSVAKEFGAEIDTYLDQGMVVIIYANECSGCDGANSKFHNPCFKVDKKQLSGGGHHWLTIVGKTNTDSGPCYICLNKGDSIKYISKDYVNAHTVKYSAVSLAGGN